MTPARLDHARAIAAKAFPDSVELVEAKTLLGECLEYIRELAGVDTDEHRLRALNVLRGSGYYCEPTETVIALLEDRGGEKNARLVEENERAQRAYLKTLSLLADSQKELAATIRRAEVAEACLASVRAQRRAWRDEAVAARHVIGAMRRHLCSVAVGSTWRATEEEMQASLQFFDEARRSYAVEENDDDSTTGGG